MIVPHAGVGNFAAVLLFPILMNYFQLGVAGAAISTVVSQYVVFITFFLFSCLICLTIVMLDLVRCCFMFQIHCYLFNDLVPQ